MRCSVFSWLCVGLAVQLWCAEAAPDWGRGISGTGHIGYIGVKGKDADSKTFVYNYEDSVRIEFGMGVGGWEGKKERDGKQGFEIMISARQLPTDEHSYAIHIDSDGSYTELMGTVRDTPDGKTEAVWAGGEEARRKLGLAFDKKNDDLSNFLSKLEAVQRLATPKGLMHVIGSAIFDPQNYKNYTQTELKIDGQKVIKREYDFDVPNDSSKHYEDHRLAKMYTTWESVLGKDNTAVQNMYRLAAFKTPVKSANVETYENEKGLLYVNLLSLYSTNTPPYDSTGATGRKETDTIIQYIGDGLF